MRFLKISLLLTITFILSSCSSGNFLEYKNIAAKYGLPQFVEPGDYPEDDGVVLLSTTDFDMQIIGSTVATEQTIHKIKKLFKNIEQYAFVEVPIYNYEKLECISARTIKADGTSIVLKPEEFLETKGVGNEAVFYSDMKTIKFTFPSIEKNCIIEYEYTKYKLTPFMNDYWYIKNNMPTLLNKYSISIPRVLMMSELDGGAGWKWNYQVYNYTLNTPTRELNSQTELEKRKIIYTWVLKDIEPFKEEPLMPPIDDYIGYVKFGPPDWKTWNDISDWYLKKYFEPQFIITNEIKDLAIKLTGGSENKTDDIKKLYDYVKNIRYVSIMLGNGNLKPSFPVDVLKRQYGDCKDKSILLISLLNAIGIKSKPVLVLTSNEGHLDPHFPSWYFNHMIVKAEVSEKENYFLDPTAKYTPFGSLPYMCENINALVLNPDYTSQLEILSGSQPKVNSKDISLGIDLKEKGDAVFNVEIKFSGEKNSSIRYILEDKTEKEIKEYCKSLLADEFSGAEITSYEVIDMDTLKSLFTLRFRGTMSNILQNQGNLKLVSSDPFKFFEITSWLIKDKRDYPLNFDYPFCLNKTITINLPKEYSAMNLPEKMDEFTGDLEYSKLFSKKGNSIVVSEKFKIINSLIAPQGYPYTKNFFETVKNRFGEKIILQKN